MHRWPVWSCRLAWPTVFDDRFRVIVEIATPWQNDVMPKNLIARLDDDPAAETPALARTEGQRLNETVQTVVAIRVCGTRR